MKRIFAVLILAAMCGCNDSDTVSNSNDSTTINNNGTNGVSEIVVSQDGQGNYVQINMETGARTPVDVTQLGSNNVVVIDITAPVIPVVPVVPAIPEPEV
jgi:hypothetical protein